MHQLRRHGHRESRNTGEDTSGCTGAHLKYFPLVWSALWRKPVETVLVWLAVTAAFTLFGLMAGLHVTYDRLVASSRLDRLDINARFPFASSRGLLLPIALREQIARIPGVSALVAAVLGGAVAWLLFNGRLVADIHNVFDLSVSPRLFAIGIAWALSLAILGGLPPAIRAARLTVAQAHRAP